MPRQGSRTAKSVLWPMVIAASVAACSDDSLPTTPLGASAAVDGSAEPPAPDQVVTITAAGSALTMWPYSGTNFSGTPQDPINLVFAGHADPRRIRAALRALDGNRTAFGMPNAYPFNCTWSDAIGGVQTAWADREQWVGSAMQLECGTYGNQPGQPLRFHMRLFRQGELTIANAHFEILIPGTTEHEVLSWELAERLVMADFARSGLLGAAPSGTQQINPAPTYRTINPTVYHALPVTLRDLIGGPGVGTDGRATILVIGGEVPIATDRDDEDFVVTYGQVIPRPFCASGPADYLFAEGPVQLRQRAEVLDDGTYQVQFEAEGHLTLTPVDPLTRAAIGEPYGANVLERHDGLITDVITDAAGLKLQHEVPTAGESRGFLREQLRATSHGPDGYTLDIKC